MHQLSPPHPRRTYYTSQCFGTCVYQNCGLARMNVRINISFTAHCGRDANFDAPCRGVHRQKREEVKTEALDKYIKLSSVLNYGLQTFQHVQERHFEQ